MEDMKFFGEQNEVSKQESSRVVSEGEKIEKREKERVIQKIALATTNQMDTGIRAVSAALKGAGFDVMRLNLYEDARHKTGANYSEEELQSIVERLKEFEAELFGISIFEVGSSRAFTLVKKIKEELGIPVLLGGQHAIQYPEECLQSGADAVCIGEGESGLVELLESWDKRLEKENPNFIVREDDLRKIKELRGRLLTEDEISRLTFDFSYHNYFVLRDGKLVSLTPENIQNPEHHQVDREAKTFVYASDRGCPMNCTFCYVNTLRKEFIEADAAKGEKTVPFLRRKRADAVIRDLDDVKKQNPWIEFLNIMNDDTAARDLQDLQEFSRLYKEKIGWPFYCMVSPMSFVNKSIWQEKGRGYVPDAVVDGRLKVQALVDAGLKELNMGIQTNGKTNFEIYGRWQPDEVLLSVTDMFHEFAREDLSKEESGKIDLFFDFIIHNPLETYEDTRRTVNLIKRLKHPFDLVAHTLYVGKQSKMRYVYENEKKKATKERRSYEKVLEDVSGESDFHDTYKFYDYLKDNYNFTINTALEFMAGRHDDKMMGRIPRYAKDLLEFDVFKKLRQRHPDFDKKLSQLQITDDMLSIDLLVSDEINQYFREQKDIFKELFMTMQEAHPIHYSNEAKERKERILTQQE